MVDSILERSKKGDFITQIRLDLNLTQELQNSIQSLSDDAVPKDYFFVTELVNPVYAYWARNANVPTPRNIKDKLSYGTRIHHYSKYWFKELDGFKFTEVSLAGAYVGIDRVSGKIDYFIGDSVIELKTKDSPVLSVQDLLTRFPHDLEQLLIYSAILSTPQDTHYLVFTEESGIMSQRVFNAFKVTITDSEAVKRVVIRRRDELSEAILRNDSSQLPKCRYYDSGCKYKESGTCNCSNLKQVNGQDLLRFIKVEEASELSRELQKIHDSASIDYEHKNIDYLWNVIFPMRWYHNKYYFYRNEEDQKELTKYSKDAAQSLVESAIYRSGIVVSGAELENLMGIHILDFEPAKRFLKAKVPSISPYSISVPYVVKISRSTWIFGEKWLPDTYLAHAACIAVNSGTKCAAIVVNYPEVNSETVVYIVCVDSGKVSKLVKSVKQAMIESIQIGSADNLPRCTDFYKGTCTFDACLCKTV